MQVGVLLHTTCHYDLPPRDLGFGIYIVHIRSHIAGLESEQGNRVAGAYLAILQLSDPINAQVKQNWDSFYEDDLTSLSQKKLSRYIKKDLRGGSISYKASYINTDQSISTHTWTFRAWLKKERRRLIWLAICVGGGLAIAWVFSIIVIGYILPLQVLFTIYVGQSRGSRVVLFCWQLLLLSAGPQLMVLFLPLA
jgi:hypothetical protein